MAPGQEVVHKGRETGEGAEEEEPEAGVQGGEQVGEKVLANL